MFKKILRYLLWTIGAAIGLSVLLVVVYRFVPVPYTPLMAIRAYEARQENRPFQIKKRWVPLANISSNLQLAVIASEDHYFFDHWGFDFAAIEQAAQYNKVNKTKRGASTISQQVAKNVFLWPGRTWVRKGLEAYLTVLIELVWSKARILEVYLNVIETGDGVFGAEAAANVYYNKPATDLNAFQAAYIAASLPNPRRFNPAQPNAYMHTRSAWIVGKMTWMKAAGFLNQLD